MEADPLFTQEIVREFILSRGGKVSNPDLVSHFKHFLNDPFRKVVNRQQFKTYINALAIVKLDESGTKVLALKKKYREGYEECSQPQAPKSVGPSGSSSSRSENIKTSDQNKKKGEVILKQESLVEEKLAPKQESLVEDEPAPKQESLVEDEPAPKQESLVEDEPAPKLEGEKEGNENPTIADEVDEEDDRNGKEEEREEEVKSMEPKTSSLSSFDRVETKDEDKQDDESVDENREDLSLVVQGLNLSKNYLMEEKQENPATSCQDLKNVNVKMISDDDDLDGANNKRVPVIMEPVRPVVGGDDDCVLRVKDAAMNIEKMESEKSSLLKIQQKTKRESRKPLSSEVNGDGEPFSMTDEDRNWLLVSCRSDYQAMCKMLQQHPQLAPKKDFITGYTALHWACKNGNMDIVKLLCGSKYSVDANARTSGGYTPLHLAAIMKHEEVMDLLIKVYKVKISLRDYSGRLARSYLDHSASTRVQHLTMPKLSGSSFSSQNSPINKSLNQSNLYTSLRSDKENSSPIYSPATTKPFHPQDYSSLMPPPTKLPQVRRKPTTCSTKSAHSDSETSEEQPTLEVAAQISGSTPNFETIV